MHGLKSFAPKSFALPLCYNRSQIGVKLIPVVDDLAAFLFLSFNPILQEFYLREPGHGACRQIKSRQIIFLPKYQKYHFLSEH